jgi:hypothetical protein
MWMDCGFGFKRHYFIDGKPACGVWIQTHQTANRIEDPWHIAIEDLERYCGRCMKRWKKDERGKRDDARRKI